MIEVYYFETNPQPTVDDRIKAKQLLTSLVDKQLLLNEVNRSFDLVTATKQLRAKELNLTINNTLDILIEILKDKKVFLHIQTFKIQLSNLPF
jgi:hypothetical protein